MELFLFYFNSVRLKHYKVLLSSMMIADRIFLVSDSLLFSSHQNSIVKKHA